MRASPPARAAPAASSPFSMKIANSSPARRPPTDSRGSARASRSLMVSMIRSPASWPKVSLISLNLSRSDVQQHQAAPLPRGARDRLLQQVLELHAVRHLGQRVEPREIADAPLRPLAIGDVAQHEDVALEGRSPRSRPPRRSPTPGSSGRGRYARRSRREPRAPSRASNAPRCSSASSAENSRARQVGWLAAEQLPGGRVRRAHAAVGVDDQHGVAHAVEQGLQIVAGDRRPGQLFAHPLERILELRASPRTPLRGRGSECQPRPIRSAPMIMARIARSMRAISAAVIPAASERQDQADADDERQPSFGIQRERDRRREQDACEQHREDITDFQALAPHLHGEPVRGVLGAWPPGPNSRRSS